MPIILVVLEGGILLPFEFYFSYFQFSSVFFFGFDILDSRPHLRTSSIVLRWVTFPGVVFF